MPDSTHDSDDKAANELAAVSRVYDRWARVYNWNPLMALVEPVRERAIASMNLSPGDVVVDMGTGTGANLPHLRDAVGPNGTVVGIDVSTGMLAKARTRIERHAWNNVQLLRGDVQNPPIDGPIDGICSAFVVNMFEHPDRLIETWAALVEDGAITNIYANPSDHWYGPAVNVLLETYCRLFEAGWGAFDDTHPTQLLARRGQLSRTALTEHATITEHDDALLGILKRDTGHIEQ